MKWEVNTMFCSYQSDLFYSGMASKLGSNAFFVYAAIKTHVDLNTGECWPSIRHLMEKTGLAKATIQKAVTALETHSMLRVKRGTNRKPNRYVARERLEIKFGAVQICTIVIDYVPTTLKNKLEIVKRGVKTGKFDESFAAEAEIIPAEGFVWDSATRKLVSRLEIKEAPLEKKGSVPSEDTRALINKVEAIRKRRHAK